MHNRYQLPGGEDVVVAQESAMLRCGGHNVDLFEANNDHIEPGAGGIDAVRAALRCVYSKDSARTMLWRVSDFRPDVVHIHNFFPTLSPSIHHVLSSAGVPVVQTLHNYRLLCPASTLLRDGKPCEDCAFRLLPLPAVRHKCYRGSMSASAAVAAMLAFHRQLGTWRRTVSRFIALSEFAREKFTAGGIPREKIVVKPNFVASDPGIGSGRGGYALFVGRLAEEKGIQVLLDAWKLLPLGIQLRIVGDGPLRQKVEQTAHNSTNIEWLPWQSREEVCRLMADAAVLIMPSIWYEGFGLVIIEAYATALPVIASQIGVLGEIVEDGVTGRLFQPGNAQDLARKVTEILSSPARLSQLRSNARREYEEKYTPNTNYDMLMDIYWKAIGDECGSACAGRPSLVAGDV
ncbi:MAG: glycosyltransferase family 4 protein [Acidobacteriaceae bacterium]